MAINNSCNNMLCLLNTLLFQSRVSIKHMPISFNCGIIFKGVAEGVHRPTYRQITCYLSTLPSVKCALSSQNPGFASVESTTNPLLHNYVLFYCMYTIDLNPMCGNASSAVPRYSVITGLQHLNMDIFHNMFKCDKSGNKTVLKQPP